VKPVERLDYQASIDRPHLALPDGKRVAVFIVVNVENWDIARAMPRQVLTAPQGASVLPDLPNWAWHEYGMRAGFWRLKAALDAHGIAPSMTINGTVPAAYPRVTQAARDAGWEFMGHGFRQIATHLVEDQRAMIRDAVTALRDAAGHDIVGWLAPGLTETLETPDLLAEAGIRYCADWVVDDLPCTLRTAHGPLLTMPYSVELNDIPMMMIQHHAARELFDRTVAQFRPAVCRGRDAGGEGDGRRGASLYQRRAASHRLVRAGAGLHGGEARHAVLAGTADHGVVPGSDGVSWGAMNAPDRLAERCPGVLILVAERTRSRLRTTSASVRGTSI
jgi:allantoinase